MDKKRIDISNYEAWMLDSMEGRLSNDEELQLQDFLAAHPELNEDMELFSDLSLSPVDLTLPNKESLKMPEEQELLIISALESGSDGLEFSGEDFKEFQRYQQTILEADLAIVFPDKESLKQKERTPIIPMWVSRLAIAASLIGVVLTLFFQQQPEIYEPRLSKAELPSFDTDFYEESNSRNFAESEIKPAPEEIQTQAPELTNQLAQDESNPIPDPSPDSIFYENDMDVELAQKSEDEILNDFIEVDSPDTEFAEKPAFDEEELDVNQDEPAIAEVPELENTENEPLLANVPEEVAPKNEKVTQSKTREIGSVMDLLKHATRDSDILALQDANKNSAYVETSLKFGRFELAVKRKRKN
jgi:hypothetical protein